MPPIPSHLGAAEDEALPLAAIFYPARQKRDHGLLKRFAEGLQADGVAVGGLVQESLQDAAGCKVGIDAIELDTGQRFPINRPSRADLDSNACSLNPQVLTEATGAIRRAVEARMDLIVVEKFGEQEQDGKGLADDILHAIAEGIPMLVAVPNTATDLWQSFSGGLATPLTYDMDALEGWWKSINTAD